MKNTKETTPKRIVITALEGSGKSASTFKRLNEIATREKPILFACKNYLLMVEQVKNWSRRFEVPISDFAIASSSFSNARYCSTPTNPSHVPDEARFIFTSQACLQRNKHLSFTKDTGMIEYQTIVVDEFDLSCGIIPTLDYLCNHSHVAKDTADSRQIQFLARQYTRQDVKNAMSHHKFVTAAWITESKCDIIYLTSETLAARLLELIGFELVHHDNPKDKHEQCTINVFSSPLVGIDFIQAINSQMFWEELAVEYDYVITDKARHDLDSSFTVNHTAARGSNAFLGKNILTILTHVPQHVISLYRDVFQAYGSGLNFDDIFAYYYRDRLCQAVGRVLNFRGSETTDVIANSTLINSIMRVMGKEFPYKVEFRLDLDLDKILEFVQECRKSKQQQTQEKLEKILDQRPKLNNLFSLAPDSLISLSEVKMILKAADVKSNTGRGFMKPSQVAEYFGLSVKQKTYKGKCVRCIVGLKQS